MLFISSHILNLTTRTLLHQLVSQSSLLPHLRYISFTNICIYFCFKTFFFFLLKKMSCLLLYFVIIYVSCFMHNAISYFDTCLHAILKLYHIKKKTYNIYDRDVGYLSSDALFGTIYLL